MRAVISLGISRVNVLLATVVSSNRAQVTNLISDGIIALVNHTIPLIFDTSNRWSLEHGWHTADLCSG